MTRTPLPMAGCPFTRVLLQGFHFRLLTNVTRPLTSSASTLMQLASLYLRQLPSLQVLQSPHCLRLQQSRHQRPLQVCLSACPPCHLIAAQACLLPSPLVPPPYFVLVSPPAQPPAQGLPLPQVSERISLGTAHAPPARHRWPPRPSQTSVIAREAFSACRYSGCVTRPHVLCTPRLHPQAMQ